jgi:hypothetical protein
MNRNGARDVYIICASNGPLTTQHWTNRRALTREREWSVWMTESTRFLCQLERGPGEHGHSRWSVIRSFSFLFPSDIWTTGSNGTGCPASACAQRLAGPDTLPGYARIISYDTRTPPYHRRNKSRIRTARARAVDGQAGCFLPPLLFPKLQFLAGREHTSTLDRGIWHVNRVRTDPMRSEHVSSSGYNHQSRRCCPLRSCH